MLRLVLKAEKYDFHTFILARKFKYSLRKITFSGWSFWYSFAKASLQWNAIWRKWRIVFPTISMTIWALTTLPVLRISMPRTPPWTQWWVTAIKKKRRWLNCDLLRKLYSSYYLLHFLVIEPRFLCQYFSHICLGSFILMHLKIWSEFISIGIFLLSLGACMIFFQSKNLYTVNIPY